MTLWAAGVNPLLRAADPSEGSSTSKAKASIPPFAESDWGARARSWTQTALRLTDVDWAEIVEEMAERVPQGENGEGNNGNDDNEPDPRAAIEL